MSAIGGEPPGATEGQELSPDEMDARYGEISGRDLRALPWYIAFGYFKLAVISEGIAARYLQGKTGRPRAFRTATPRATPLFCMRCRCSGSRCSTVGEAPAQSLRPSRSVMRSRSSRWAATATRNDGST